MTDRALRGCPGFPRTRALLAAYVAANRRYKDARVRWGLEPHAWWLGRELDWGSQLALDLEENPEADFGELKRLHDEVLEAYEAHGQARGRELFWSRGALAVSRPAVVTLARRVAPRPRERRPGRRRRAVARAGARDDSESDQEGPHVAQGRRGASA
jgi:hypothetical protein